MADKILKELNGLPIFRMSLGSKELFHSNFLEYLWSVDTDGFKRMINMLLGENALNNDNYILSREKENFDICIYHEDSNKRPVYDVIIENKVKSIPSKKQLDDYVEKVNGGTARDQHGQRPHFLLLSLIENFCDRKEIEDEEVWKIVNYEALHNVIKDCYQNIEGKDRIYIDDYCSFISNMHKLQQQIVSGNFESEELWADYDLYKQYRLHDLYIKLRGLKFIELLQRRLEDKGVTYATVHIGGFRLREWWNSNQRKDVYLNWNVFKAVGQIAAFLYNGNKEIREIVIQGNQYRHGINYYDKQRENITLDEIWEEVGKSDFITQIEHEGKKTKDHCQYKPDYVYVYNKIDSQMTIGQLLDRMAVDVVNTKTTFFAVAR